MLIGGVVVRGESYVTYTLRGEVYPLPRWVIAACEWVAWAVTGMWRENV